MRIEAIEFFDTPQGADLEVEISNATQKVNFFAELFDGDAPPLEWAHDELWNTVAIAVLDGETTKTMEITGVFSGTGSFDLTARIVEDGETVAEIPLTNLANNRAVRVIIDCFMSDEA